MASPMPHQPQGGWNGNNESMPPHPQSDLDDSAVQCRPMGLKVHYTFDKEGKVNCLARSPQTIRVQTVAIDETRSIGVIDLRHCLEAVTECSPELASQHCDYTIYALDYSEPDTPLVGQGMLSRIMETMRTDCLGQSKMVTGRVTRNVLAVFGGGNRETLEVKLRLTEAVNIQKRPCENPRPIDMGHNTQHSRPMEPSMTPTGTAEWNSFIQSNPQLGQPTNFPRGSSPAFSQGLPSVMMHERRDSFPQASQQSILQQNFQRIAPTPIDAPTVTNAPQPPSRPSSRASNSSRTSRKKPSKKTPTGRPVGRPRKKPLEYAPLPTGNTSGYEDGTEGEDGPAKKRVKTTQVDKVNTNPFGAGPDSLRVAASTSGSLRNFRPIAMSNEGLAAGGHLQEVPRAPTPVPRGPVQGVPGRGNSSRLGRESSMSREAFANQPSPQTERPRALTPGQEDGRSPDESVAPTPATYSDSPAAFGSDIGSSPPVPRRMNSFRSSPAPSSPVLPPMPQPQMQQASNLANVEPGHVFGEEPVGLRPAVKAPGPTRIRKMVPQSGQRGKAAAVPMQVFRMEDGPDGQEMVHVMSYNNADAIDTPAPPPWFPPGTVVKQRPSSVLPPRKKIQTLSPPVLAPTPPPTTDSIEKPPTSDFTLESAQTPVADALPPPLLPVPTPAADAASQRMPSPPLNKSVQPSFAPLLPENPSDKVQEPTTAVEPENNSNAEVSQPTLPVAKPSTDEQLSVDVSEPTLPKPKVSKPRARPRKLARSQSTGLSVLPEVPASEPIGLSSLSQFTIVEPLSSVKAPPTLCRAASAGPLNASIPASDPVGPLSLPPLAFPRPPSPIVDAPLLPPSSPPGGRSRKNIVKKHAIRQRLEMAIMNGEMPPFCSNCGAIQTPTWRKIWIQDREGVPEEVLEKGGKPGQVTAIEITTRDEDEQPTSYRIVKKVLAADEDKDQWQDLLLCNPCGIWLAKNNLHRPQDRWEKDASRLGQERTRKKRGSGTDAHKQPRTKIPRTKLDQTNLTSEAYLPTDALGPVEPYSHKNSHETLGAIYEANTAFEATVEGRQPSECGDKTTSCLLNPGSTHSRGSGTAKSPIALDTFDLDEAMGTTKRLLFPSPQRNTDYVLGTLDVNTVHISNECRMPKEFATDKENLAITQGETMSGQDDLESLFRSPAPARPSTPPPSVKVGPSSTPFKTPTRATPHRPITRSVSRSIRSLQSGAALKEGQRTPTRTPRGLTSSETFLNRRRSPRNHETVYEEANCYTPVSRAISQMLSDNPILSDHNFGGFGDDVEMDFGDLPPIQATQNMFDSVNNWFSTDAIMPTSPAKDETCFEYDGSATVFEEWNLSHGVVVEKLQE